MIEAYADGVLFYDSRTEDTRLLGLTATPSATKAGTAEIILPPGHPSFDRFVSYRTVVEIYRRESLIFRGRALYHEDDLYNCRSVVCEGERSFFRDSVMRPYLYQDTPAAIFADIVNQHNQQVGAAKSFVVGTITVVDDNDYVRIESQSAEQTSDTLDKLVSRCGGYLTFTTNASGQRCVNWLEKLDYLSGQAIEFGENLLDFSRSSADTGLATRIYPYGVKNYETGERVTIESVNGGIDYVQDDEAVALRGVIALPVFWDDVTLPENLLRKANQYLAKSKLMVTTLSLSAVDLSALDKDIDTFQVGDMVRVVSAPHGVDDLFLLQERTYDLLNPANDWVTLGKDLATLTGAGATAQKDALSQLQRTEREIRTEYTVNTAQAIEEATRTLKSLIEQTEEGIRTEVSETYVTSSFVDQKVSAGVGQLAEDVAKTYATPGVVDQKVSDSVGQLAEDVAKTYATPEVVDQKVNDGVERLAEDVANTYATPEVVDQKVGDGIEGLSGNFGFVLNNLDKVKEDLISMIEQTSGEILATVSATYATNEELTSKVSTSMQQLSDSFNFTFTSLRSVVDENDKDARRRYETIQQYIRFEDGNILLGESGNELTLRIENDRIRFLDSGTEVAYFSNKQLYVTDAHFLNSLRLGKFAWLPRKNGNLSLVKVGD